MDKEQQIFEDFTVPDPIRIRKATKFVHQYFGNVKNLSVLECGIAKGGLAELLAKEGARCVGVDIHPRKVRGVETLQTDLNDGFPELETKFDVIFAGEVMEHIFDDSKFIKNCKKLLKPNGVLIVTVPNLVFSVNRVRMFFGQTPLFAYAPYHYHMYTKKTLTEAFKKEGLNILKVLSSHILFSTRRNKLGRIFEILGDIFPSFGAHLIIFARKEKNK